MNAPTARMLARASARRRRGAALRRALLGDPPRRPAGGAARGGARQSATSPSTSARGSRTSRSTATASRSRRSRRGRAVEERGIALIGADGLWSSVRRRLGHRGAPRFARPHRLARAGSGRCAWCPTCAQPAVNLWLGRNAHLVHYPVRGGSLINIVAIIRDDWRSRAGHAPGERARDPRPLSGRRWPAPARALLAAPQHWHKWALYDRAPARALGQGTGHAAGRRRPSDAALSRAGRRHGDRGRRRAGERLADTPDDPDGAMRRYERQRRAPHRAGPARGPPQRHGLSPGRRRALLRTLALIAHGRRQRLLARYDWLYGWKPA